MSLRSENRDKRDTVPIKGLKSWGCLAKKETKETPPPNRAGFPPPFSGWLQEHLHGT